MCILIAALDKDENIRKMSRWERRTCSLYHKRIMRKGFPEARTSSDRRIRGRLYGIA